MKIFVVDDVPLDVPLIADAAVAGDDDDDIVIGDPPSPPAKKAQNKNSKP